MLRNKKKRRRKSPRNDQRKCGSVNAEKQASFGILCLSPKHGSVTSTSCPLAKKFEKALSLQASLCQITAKK